MASKKVDPNLKNEIPLRGSCREQLIERIHSGLHTRLALAILAIAVCTVTGYPCCLESVDKFSWLIMEKGFSTLGVIIDHNTIATKNNVVLATLRVYDRGKGIL